VAEGWRIEEVADAIDQNPRFSFSGEDFLAIAGTNAPLSPSVSAEYGFPAGASLEGFLFPDTYILPPSITAVGLIDTLVNAFRDAVGEQLRIDAHADGYSMYEIVTLASIV